MTFSSPIFISHTSNALIEESELLSLPENCSKNKLVLENAYGEILAPLCSDDPRQILLTFRIICVALVGHNKYQFLAPNLHQHAGFLTKRLS